MSERNSTVGERRNQWWITAMLVLFGIITPIAISLSWLAFLVLDAERFTRTVTPIIDMPEVQRSVAASLTDAVRVSLDSAVQSQRSVRGLVALAGGTGAVVATASGAINIAVTTPEFRVLWEDVNRAAHIGLVDVLSRDPKSDMNLNDDLTLLFDEIELWSGVDPTSPIGQALQSIPTALAPRLTVLTDLDIPVARFLIDHAKSLAYTSIAFAVALFGGALALGRNRRQVLIVGGLLGVIALAPLLLTRTILHDRLSDLSGVQGELAREYARALTSPLESLLILTSAVGLIVAGLAWVWPRLSRRESLQQPA